MEKEKKTAEGTLPAAYTEEITRLHRENPFAALLGVEIDGLAGNYCRLRLPLRDKCTNPYGGVHGGVLATLADISMGIALRTIGLQPVTAELTVNYLGQAEKDLPLLAEGRVTHRGNTLILTECEVRSGEKTVAQARGIFMSRGALIKE